MNTYQQWRGCMKCYPFEEKRLAKWSPPYIIQPKYDGIRCRAVRVNDVYILLSSEENVIFSVPHINIALDILQTTAELDGELYCHDMSFEQILSITSRSTNLHPDHFLMEFHVFDVVNKLPQVERLAIIEGFKDKHESIKVAPFYVAHTLDGVKTVYDTFIKEGYEGIIIRHFLNRYETKRSTMVMKYKPKKADTYNIVGWREEVSVNGDPKGRIGSLIMSSQTGDEFGVSAGLDGLQKDHLWSIRDQLAGKQAVIHYQHLTDRKIPKGTFNVEVLL